MLPSPFNEPTLRDDIPRYSPLVQMLRITGTQVSGPSGFPQVAGSSVLGPTLYVSFTQQMRDDGSLLPRDREPCLADDVNGVGLSPGFYLGRLASSFNGLPVYEITEQVSSSGGGSGGATPKFHGARYVSGGSTQTIFQNSLTTITIMTTKEIDTDNYYNGSSFKIPAGLSGYYLIGMSTSWDTVTAQTSFVSAVICNNTVAPENQIVITVPANSPTTGLVSTNNIIKFNIGPVLLLATNTITFKAAELGTPTSLVLNNATMELALLGVQ